MLKKKVTVSDLIRRSEILKSLSVVAFDNPGGPDGDKTDDFSEEMLPQELRGSFQKYKQNLIDKGVNIGVAREKERFERNKGAEIDNYLSSQGMSRSDIESLKPFLGKGESLKALFSAYGTEDFDEIASLIKEAENNGFSANADPDDPDGFNIEELASSLESISAENEDLKAQISALQSSLSEKDSIIADKEKALSSFIEKTVINAAIKQAALDAGAYDVEDVLDRIKPQIKLEVSNGDYIPFVVDDKGVKRYDSNGDPFSIQALVSDFLDKRPHLRKSTLPGGPGAKPVESKSPIVSGKFTKEQLKDPVFFQKHYNEIMADVRAGNIKI